MHAPDSADIQHRLQEVVLETGRHRIRGWMTLSRDGYRSRVSDILNASERDFVAVTDATVELLDGTGGSIMHPFLAVSRRHVVLAAPLGDG